MKIIKETSQKLVLKEKTGFNLSLLVWSLFFAGIPLIMIIVFFADLGVININCQRVEPTQVNCQIHRTGFGGLIKRESKVLNSVIWASLPPTVLYLPDYITIDNKLVMENKQGEIYMIKDNLYYIQNPDKIREFPSNFNKFLASNESSFVFNIDNRFLPITLLILIFLSLFIVLGGKLVTQRDYETIIMDKKSNQIYHKKVNLLGTKKETYSLREITSIIIEQSTDSDGDKSYTLILPIANQKYTLDYSSSINYIQEIATKISNFLQITIENVVK